MFNDVQPCLENAVILLRVTNLHLASLLLDRGHGRRLHQRNRFKVRVLSDMVDGADRRVVGELDGVWRLVVPSRLLINLRILGKHIHPFLSFRFVCWILVKLSTALSRQDHRHLGRK